MNTFFKSPSTSRPGAAAPPSAFKNGTLSAPTAVAYNNPSASSSTVSLSRRHSRTNLDFEQALATDTTVHLKDSVDVNVLGAEAFATPPRRGSGADSNDFTTASSRREGRRTQAAQPSTPVVLPPTPASASKSSNKVYQHESDPTDPDFQTKRRSMFRSPGTASSPDLATLVRKAKERRGIVGSSSNADDRSRPPEFRVDGAPPVDVVQDPTSSLSGALLSPASSDQPRGRARSSTSSSYSIISTPSVQATPTRPQISSGSQMATPSPPSKLMKGKSRTTDSGTSSRSHKDDPKASVRTKTSAFFSKMLGSGSVRRPDTAPNTPSTYTPPPLFASFVQTNHGQSQADCVPPVPPMPAHYRPTTAPTPSSPPASTEVFNITGRSKPLPPIRAKPPNLSPETSEDEVEQALENSGQLDLTTPEKPKSKPVDKSKWTSSGRRRSRSVGDADMQRIINMGPPPPNSPSTKPNHNTPKQHRNSRDGAPLREWDAAMTGIMTDFSREFPGYTAASPKRSARASQDTSRTSTSTARHRPSLSASASAKLTPIITTSDPRPPSNSDSSTAPPASASSPSSDVFFTPPPGSSFEDNLSPMRAKQPSPSTIPSTSLPPPASPPQLTSPILISDPITPMMHSPRSSSLRLSPNTHPTTPNPRVASLQGRVGGPRRPGASPRYSTEPGRAREFSMTISTPTSLAASHEAARSKVQPQAGASSSEPSLNNPLPLVPRHSDGQGRPLSPLDGPVSALGLSRTIRLVPSTGAFGSHSSPSSPGRVTRASSDDLAADNSEEMEARGKDLATKCWVDDESFLGKEKIAEWLGGLGRINKIALKYYIDFFDFGGMRLDNAFRHLCAKLYLKAETQQVDRILEEFSRRYWDCNPSSLFGGADVVHAVSYSLLLLNTDLHVAELASHMSKNQFIRNTLAVINAQIKPDTPRSSTPELAPDDPNGSTDFVEIGPVDSTGQVPKTREKRSGSVNSWRSGSKDTLTTVPSAYQSSTQLSAPAHSFSPTASFSSSPGRIIGHKASQNSISSIVYGRNWENDVENLLKEIYNAVKSQQILQPQLHLTVPERHSTSSLSPGNTMLRQRSQRGQPNADRLNTFKRGSIRGLQTLLGSQSAYSSNSSVDGRLSPSPSFASIGDGVSASASSLFTPSLGFASNLSHTIIKEAQEDDDTRSLGSVRSASSNMSITDEELALFGAPWAKEGMLCRKQYWESTGKRAKTRAWMDVFVVIQKGELNMFIFGEGNSAAGGGTVGGGNWLSNAQAVGDITLAHSLAHALPPPGYNRQRPHCLVLTLASGGVYFFQAGTEDLVNEWVQTCNYWAARQSKEPLQGGVSNMEYGWNRVQDMMTGNPQELPVDRSDAQSDSFSMRSGRSKFSKRNFDGPGSARLPQSPYVDRIQINEWKAPMPPTVSSVHDEESQLEALQKQARSLKNDLKNHNDLRIPMMDLYPHRSTNAAKAQANWERKSQYLLTEIVKYDSYVESLRSAMGKRLKKRGERVMERALGEDDGGDDEVLYITRQADDLGPVSARTERTMTGQQDLRTAPIEEADEPPLNYGSGSGTLHRREIAELDARRGSV